MNETLLSRLLAGDKEAVEAFGESDNCVVVDWRAGLPEILEAITPFVRSDYLRVERRAEAGYLVRAGTRDPQILDFPPRTRQEELFVAVNRALLPDFELRQYTPVDGDGYALFLAPPTVWKSIELSHPQATERYFLSVERLAAYWRKGYFARLFSKP